MSKKTLPIGVFLLIIVGTGFIQYKATIPQKKVVSDNLITVKQTIEIDGEKKTASQKVKFGTTALQLLTQSRTVKTQGEGKNAFVTSIGERSAKSAEREFWALYVNGRQAAVGAGSYYVKNNDTIEWKIETY